MLKINVKELLLEMYIEIGYIPHETNSYSKLNAKKRPPIEMAILVPLESWAQTISNLLGCLVSM